MVVGYEPSYSPDRRLWFVDVPITGAGSLWPFVRLVVVRYQPNSVAGCHISLPTRCDFVQLPPERTASISRTDETTVRVVVSGPVARHDTSRRRVPEAERWAADVDVNRTLLAKVQHRPAGSTSDVAWKTEHTVELPLFSRAPYKRWPTVQV